MDPSVGHLNGILARVEGNMNNNFQKSQMPGGKLKLRLTFAFDFFFLSQLNQPVKEKPAI